MTSANPASLRLMRSNRVRAPGRFPARSSRSASAYQSRRWYSFGFCTSAAAPREHRDRLAHPAPVREAAGHHDPALGDDVRRRRGLPELVPELLDPVVALQRAVAVHQRRVLVHRATEGDVRLELVGRQLVAAAAVERDPEQLPDRGRLRERGPQWPQQPQRVLLPVGRERVRRSHQLVVELRATRTAHPQQLFAHRLGPRTPGLPALAAGRRARDGPSCGSSPRARPDAAGPARPSAARPSAARSPSGRGARRCAPALSARAGRSWPRGSASTSLRTGGRRSPARHPASVLHRASSRPGARRRLRCGHPLPGSTRIPSASHCRRDRHPRRAIRSRIGGRGPGRRAGCPPSTSSDAVRPPPPRIGRCSPCASHRGRRAGRLPGTPRARCRLAVPAAAARRGLALAAGPTGGRRLAGARGTCARLPGPPGARGGLPALRTASTRRARPACRGLPRGRCPPGSRRRPCHRSAWRGRCHGSGCRHYGGVVRSRGAFSSGAGAERTELPVGAPDVWRRDEGAPGVDAPSYEKSRRRPTLPGGCPPSTIGAGGLHFRVRNGNGCFPAAIATGNLDFKI